MLHVRLGTRFLPTVALVAAGVLGCQTATAAAIATAATREASPVRSNVNFGGMVEQQINGHTDACGSAARVDLAAALLARIGVGNVAFFTGAGRTGTGCVVVTGNRQPVGTDFRIRGLTAASVANNTDQPVAVYSDQTGNLDAVVPARTDADITPVDVNFASYSQGTTPPPDDRGLVPTAVFQFPS
jgi:hypothetical protein